MQKRVSSPQKIVNSVQFTHKILAFDWLLNSRVWSFVSLAWIRNFDTFWKPTWAKLFPNWSRKVVRLPVLITWVTNYSLIWVPNIRCINIDKKNSAFWLTEIMSINPKRCKNLKFLECRNTKLVQQVEIKNDWPWKMADTFAESNNILIQSLKDNVINKNTQQSTNNWINVWTNRILVGGTC